MTLPRGTQAERTRLAWRRTVLTLTVVALLAVRLALLADSPGVRAFAVAVAMLLWLTGLVVAAYRIRGVSGPVPRGLVGAGPVALLVVATVVGVAVLGAGLALV